ncbi:MAG: hypothetical protein JSW33_15855 [bacterium]|nr:MAG: hypothetical protein JSW33_15855 [bacterium]
MISRISGVFIFLFFLAEIVFAQGYGGRLTYQGLDHPMLHSAAGRAMGGISVGVNQDLGLMFQNPATLKSIQGIQFSVGGQILSSSLDQEQNYAPVRYYSNLSLLLEGLTVYIPDPDTSLPGFTAMDTVQRPYDDIGPNWSQSDDNSIPLQVMLAVPLAFNNLKIIAGVGAIRYADLDHYYQNNNVLSPGILSQRPLPTLRPTDDNPIEVEWSQSIRSRKGSIQGYGFSLAGSLENYDLAIGFSGLFLKGNSDDFEQEIGRGKLTFFSNAFRNDSVYSKIVTTGESEYSGSEFTLSSIYTGRYASLGFSVKFPTTITRTFSLQVSTDTTGIPVTTPYNGEEKLKLPWRGMIGLSLNPRSNLTIGLEYEHRPYGSVQYVDTDGTEMSPWLAVSLLKAGLEFRPTPWLALRGGMRGEAEVFEPEGAQIIGEPVTYTIYSAGTGFRFYGFQLDITYEYSNRKYEDIWASAISKNSDQRHVVVAQLSYLLPWIP